jgi:hypothetical protein
MCAKDRSHIAVRSQTDSIHSMREMLNISSCPAFIRDSRGEVIHTSPGGTTPDLQRFNKFYYNPVSILYSLFFHVTF